MQAIVQWQSIDCRGVTANREDCAQPWVVSPHICAARPIGENTTGQTTKQSGSLDDVDEKARRLCGPLLLTASIAGEHTESRQRPHLTLAAEKVGTLALVTSHGRRCVARFGYI